MITRGGQNEKQHRRQRGILRGMNRTTAQIAPEQKRQYREQGFFVLERAMSGEHLELVRSEFGV